jgi:hypothetical protein
LGLAAWRFDMKKHQEHQDENSLPTKFTDKSQRKFGRTELYLLLLLLFAGITVDTCFNHHQLPWKSSDGNVTSEFKAGSAIAPPSSN